MIQSEENWVSWRISLGDMFIFLTGICISISLSYFLIALRPTEFETKAVYAAIATFFGTLVYVIARINKCGTLLALAAAILIGVLTAVAFMGLMRAELRLALG